MSTVFLLRGPWRALSTSHDLAPVYGGARAFVQGDNPYDGRVLTSALLEGGRGMDREGRTTEGGAVYAPFTLGATAPLGMLRWQQARLVFLLTVLALVAGLLSALLRLSATSIREADGALLASLAVGLAPIHTGIAFGQLAIPCVALVVMSLADMRAGRETRAGLLLGAGVLFKPQLAAPFVLFAALRDHKRSAATATLVVGVATAAAIAWFSAHDVSWYQSWRSSLTGVAGSVEHDPAGAFGVQLVDLRPVLVAAGVPGSAALAFLIAAGAGIGLYRWGRRLAPAHDLLLASAVATLTLLATYHRTYDAAILVLPIAWVVSACRAQRVVRQCALTALACCAVFVVWPGGWVLQRAAAEGWIPAALVQSKWWDVFLLRHQNWALIVLTIALLVAARALHSKPPSPLGAPSVSHIVDPSLDTT